MPNKANEIIADEKEPVSSRANWGRAGFFFSTLAIVISVCTLGYSYFQLANVNISLAQNVSVLKKQSAASRDDIAALQKSVNDLQQAAQKSQELSAKQEQIISDWQAAQKGDLNKWYVAEAQYLVKLANDHVQFTHNILMAMTLLQRADQVLQNLNDPDLLEIRKSLAADIANLQVLPAVDITSLYLNLSTLDNQIDQLTLPVNPLKADTKKEMPVVEQPGTPWWKTGLDTSLNALRKIVIVRHISANSENSMPLVLPEEKMFLYQNLHSQMESVLWGVLHRNNDVYQLSLTRAIDWIQKYFVQDAPVTTAVLKNLQVLKKISLQPPIANFSATLQLFDNYFVMGQAK